MNRIIDFNLRVPGTALAALVLLALACRFSPDAPAATPTEPGFLPLTAVAQVTPSPPERRPCPIPTSSAPAPTPAEPGQAAGQFFQFLNQGGNPQELATSGPNIDVARPDVDGDGWVDLAFIVRGSQSNGIVTPGTLLVFHCSQNSYQLVYTAPDRPDLSAPAVHSSEDLNVDGRDEILISRRSCGAHTCTAQVELLQWRGGSLENRLQGPTDDLPSPAIEVRPGSEGEPNRIAVTATGINSVGAGPFRPVTRIWSWDPDAQRYQASDEQLQPPEYRVHALHDADRAARSGDLERAASGYRRVIQDDGLRGWVEPERERALLSAFARYRLVAVELRGGQLDTVQQWLDELRATTESGGPGAAYVSLAETLWNEYQRSGDFTTACRAAREYAAAQSAQILDPLYFGYANPTYSAEDMCVLGEE
ncbi:MAG: hypothetical protein R3191_06600 [Anaerolineales bacterium]|nr:hypothetical protein [Anaerolineales bacterium]